MSSISYSHQSWRGADLTRALRWRRGDAQPDGVCPPVMEAVIRTLTDSRSTRSDSCKFIAYSEDAQPLLEAAGIASDLDEGCIKIGTRKDATDFITTCGKLRHWDRERSVDLDG